MVDALPFECFASSVYLAVLLSLISSTGNLMYPLRVSDLLKRVDF